MNSETICFYCPPVFRYFKHWVQVMLGSAVFAEKLLSLLAEVEEFAYVTKIRRTGLILSNLDDVSDCAPIGTCSGTAFALRLEGPSQSIRHVSLRRPTAFHIFLLQLLLARKCGRSWPTNSTAGILHIVMVRCLPLRGGAWNFHYVRPYVVGGSRSVVGIAYLKLLLGSNHSKWTVGRWVKMSSPAEHRAPVEPNERRYGRRASGVVRQALSRCGTEGISAGRFIHLDRI